MQGQPAVLALDSVPILLAHATHLPADGASKVPLATHQRIRTGSSNSAVYDVPSRARSASLSGVSLTPAELHAEPVEIVMCVRALDVAVDGFESCETGEDTSAEQQQHQRGGHVPISQRMRGAHGPQQVVPSQSPVTRNHRSVVAGDASADRQPPQSL